MGKVFSEHGLASIRASDKRTGYDISFVADVLQYLKTDSTTARNTADSKTL